MKFYSTVILILLLNARVFASSSDVCLFYLEKNDELGCSSENYLTQFGFKYCERFLQNADLFSSHGQMVLDAIRNCLIDELKNTAGLTCENVEPAAQDMHLRCYNENDFCSLSFWDKNKIFWMIKNELSDSVFFRTFLKVSNSCLL